MDSLGIRICRRLDMASPSSPFGGFEEGLAIVHPVTSRFGMSMPVGVVDVINLIKSGDYRVAQMGKGFGEFSATWAKKDPAAFADFSNDYMGLVGRWARAKVAAKSTSAMISQALGSGLTGGLAGGTAAYEGLARALKQGGESAALQRGDFEDLVSRLTKAGGLIDLSQLPHDTFSPAAAVQAVGNALPQLPANPFASLEEVFKWMKDHQHELVLAGMAIGGLMLFGVVLTAIKAAPLVLKGATAGVL
jgi:hypothetical protein